MDIKQMQTDLFTYQKLADQALMILTLNEQVKKLRQELEKYQKIEAAQIKDEEN